MITYNGEKRVRFTGFSDIDPKKLAKYCKLEIGNTYRVDSVYPSSNSIIILNDDDEMILLKFNEVETP